MDAIESILEKSNAFKRANESMLKIIIRKINAKRVLNTTYSIAEVGYFINFNDSPYSTRLFKKRVGLVLGEFHRG